jgi:phosphoribosylformylglycinamidine synthase
LILSAHDVSGGGLAVTIAESCFASDGLSADMNLTRDAEAAEVALFGERGSRAVVSLSAASLARLDAVAAQYGVAANRIGSVTRSEFRIQLNGTPVIRGDVSSFHKAWSESLVAAIENHEL